MTRAPPYLPCPSEDHLIFRQPPLPRMSFPASGVGCDPIDEGLAVRL